MYYAIDDTEELEHHGIKGQKWGVRRFQNVDGTRTALGKRREQRDSDGDKKVSIDKKTVAKVALGVGAAVAIAHPATRAVLTKYGKTAISKLSDPNTAYKIGSKLGEGTYKAGKAIGKGVKTATSNASSAVLTAAIASVGDIAISKLDKRLDPGANASEGEKNKSKVINDSLSAGIRAATKSNNFGGGKGSGNGNSKVDKGSPEYQNLFSGLESKEDRQKIKDRANSGASMEELKKLRDELGHTDFDSWASQYMAVEIGW